MQAASTILMIQPGAFGFDQQTGAFGPLSHLPAHVILERALEEFDIMVNTLLQHHIDVLVAGDTTPPKPAAIFPANWFCTNNKGIITVFPLHASGRRMEKRDDILLALSQKFIVNDVLDLGEYEAEGFFLEGTASMVIDHPNKIIYAGISPYTHKTLLQHFARFHGYRAMAFTAMTENDRPVNYTNNILSIGERFAILCEAAIKDEFERIAIRQLLSTTGHTIIPVSIEQAQQFAANITEIKNTRGENIIVLSRQAFNSLTHEQVHKLYSFGKLVVVPIPTIETIGRNSVSSMMAPIYLQEKQAVAKTVSHKVQKEK